MSVNKMSEPLAWVCVVLSVCTAACFIVFYIFRNQYNTELKYIDAGYVAVNIRYPSTFVDRKIWVREENVDKYIQFNREFENNLKNLMGTFNDVDTIDNID